jgi:hypothetical protein
MATSNQSGSQEKIHYNKLLVIERAVGDVTLLLTKQASDPQLGGRVTENPRSILP